MWGTRRWTTLAASLEPSISITSSSYAHIIRPTTTAYRHDFRRIQTNVAIAHQLRSPAMALRLEMQTNPAETADCACKAHATKPPAPHQLPVDMRLLIAVDHAVLIVR
jgi:hypothetical protein